MANLKNTAKNTIFVITGLAVGLGVLFAMASNRPPAAEVEHAMTGSRVTVLTLQAVDFQPTVSGFGTVKPAFELTVLSEVAGRVAWVHPDLERGNVLPEGTTVIRLDDTDLRLALNQSESELAVKKVQLEQKALEQQNYQKNLADAESRLSLARKELARLQSLVEKGLMSNSGVDAQRQQVLAQQSEVSNLELQLQMLPSQIRILEAEIESSQARLLQRERDLDRSDIQLAKTGVIGSVNVTEGSYVGMGAQLFQVSSENDFEINAQVSAKTYQQVFNTLTLPTQIRAEVTLSNQASANAPANDLVAQPLRIDDGLDTATRMLGVVVGIDGNDHGLTKGTYAEVTLSAMESDYWVVPRSAIHDNQLYFADGNNQLRIVPAQVDFYQGDYAVLAQKPNFDRLVTSQLFPAVEGMALDIFGDVDSHSRMLTALNP